MRLNLNDAIAKARPDEPNEIDEIFTTETIYCMGGGGDANLEEKITTKTCAKLVESGPEDKKRLYHYIRIEGRLLYNPLSLYNVHTVPKNIQFRKVNKQCFDMYIKYLETQNKIYYVNAQRAV